MNTSAPHLDDTVDDNNDGITMVDVLEEQAELEEDANAVLGDSDAKNCTYPQVSFQNKDIFTIADEVLSVSDSTLAL